ncbi:MAG: hypothetical protein LBU74_02460 [Methanobacteriaceae archaeon]|nr:hypothetical protein [Candidatus Methanorudis spinitermitis]
MKKENKGNNGENEKNRLKKNHLFLATMIILLIGVAGSGVIGHTMLKNSSKTATDNIPSSKISDNNTSNEIVPKEEYALITIHGLKCYVKAEYTSFVHVTDDTDYDGMDEYFELTNGKSVDFVDYTDFAQFYTRDNKFRIEISKFLQPKDPGNYDNQIAKSKNITVNGNKVRVINIKKYSDQSVDNKEFTFVYFKVKNKGVELGWAGNTIDMYVIESFFKLN